MGGIDRLRALSYSMGGGAWPFLVGGVICLVNSVNERDLNLLTSRIFTKGIDFLEGLYVQAYGSLRQ